MGDNPIRVCLFTDTLGDVNGVSRFICNVAAEAEGEGGGANGRDLRIVTSTRLPTPRRANILNFEPVLARPMPGYAQLELVLPPVRRMLREVRRMRPDAVHISTPGPVGLVGIAAARLLHLPILGVYHTDFPAYIARLFEDHALTWLSGASMQTLYSRFAKIFTRSDDYSAKLIEMGIAPGRLVRLRPGIDTRQFDPRFADPGIWQRIGLPADAARAQKVLYVGRISVEKDLPLLAETWKVVRAKVRGGGLSPPATPQLIIVGDGPYRKQMERELSENDVHFLGFRHGRELSQLYASSDLFVFPSTTDTLGQVVMEAQCSGLPVLVSDRGGPCEVVGDGVTGRVLPAGDSHAWATALLELLARPDGAAAAMGAAAHAAMQPMSIRNSFNQFWSVHEQVVRETATAVAARRERSVGKAAEAIG